MMKASEARRKSESKFIDLETALSTIFNMAECGNTNTIFFTELKEGVSTELMELGYKLTIHKDPINGNENYVCSW